MSTTSELKYSLGHLLRRGAVTVGIRGDRLNPRRRLVEGREGEQSLPRRQDPAEAGVLDDRRHARREVEQDGTEPSRCSNLREG